MDGKDAIIARQQKQIHALLQMNLRQEKQIADLQKRVETLLDKIMRLEKNSRNSSKPPSSDIVKPSQSGKPRGRGKRRIGGQKGHPKHERKTFRPDEVDEVIEYEFLPDEGRRPCPAG